MTPALVAAMLAASPATFDCADRPGTVMVELSSGRYPGFSQLVNVVSRSKWDHAYLVTCDGRLYGASPPLVGFHPDGPALARRRYIVHADPVAVWTFALAQEGKPYDLVGNVSYIAHVNLDAIGWRCSTLVLQAFRQAGVDLAPGKKPAVVAPGTLAKSALMEAVE